jgi:multidrug efflux pump subunit AcrA (membrane-fusion protein)
MGLDPISLIFGGISLISGFAGQQSQAAANQANERARADAAQRNKQIEERNRLINEQEAAQQDAALKRSQQQTRSQEVLGALENGGGYSGFGSGLDLISQNDAVRSLDRKNLSYKYALKSQGIDINIGELDIQKGQYERNAADAGNAGFIGGVSTLASGASNLAPKFSRLF